MPERSVLLYDAGWCLFLVKSKIMNTVLAKMSLPLQRTPKFPCCSAWKLDSTLEVLLDYFIMLFNCKVPASRNLTHKSNSIIWDIQMPSIKSLLFHVHSVSCLPDYYCLHLCINDYICFLDVLPSCGTACSTPRLRKLGIILLLSASVSLSLKWKAMIILPLEVL